MTTDSHMITNGSRVRVYTNDHGYIEGDVTSITIDGLGREVAEIDGGRFHQLPSLMTWLGGARKTETAGA